MQLAAGTLRHQLLAFSDLIDGRGNEEIPEISDDGDDEQDE